MENNNNEVCEWADLRMPGYNNENLDLHKKTVTLTTYPFHSPLTLPMQTLRKYMNDRTWLIKRIQEPHLNPTILQIYEHNNTVPPCKCEVSRNLAKDVNCFWTCWSPRACNGRPLSFHWIMLKREYKFCLRNSVNCQLDCTQIARTMQPNRKDHQSGWLNHVKNITHLL